MAQFISSHSGILITLIILSQLLLAKWYLRKRFHLGADEEKFKWDKAVNGLILAFYLGFCYLMIDKFNQAIETSQSSSIVFYSIIFVVASLLVARFSLKGESFSFSAKKPKSHPANTHKDYLRKLLAQSRIKEAFTYIDDNLQLNDALADDYILIKAKFNGGNREQMNGVLTSEEIKIQRQVISQDILMWLDRYEEVART